MFKTKRDVDAHVINLLRRLKDDKEKKNRGYSIAKLYMTVDEYDMAERYLAGFLSIKPTFAPAHNLMGEIHEKQNKWSLAFEAFKRSFSLDASQKNIVWSICKVLSNMEDVDNETIKPWLERAESIFPKSDPKSSVVFSLRERMIRDIQNKSLEKGQGDASKDDGKSQLQALYAEELVKRPQDVGLRIKLLQLLVEEGKVAEAREHAFSAEEAVVFQTGPANIFINSAEWYAAVVDLLEVEKSTQSSLSSSFFLDYLHSLCLLTSLRLKESPALAAKSLHRLDQALYEAENLEENPGARRVSGNEAALWQVFLKEMRAQFFNYAGSLFLARAVGDQLQWTEALHQASICFLVSFSQDPPNLKSAFFPQSSPRIQKRLQLWYSLACLRLSVSGYTLLAIVPQASKLKDSVAQFCNKIQQACAEPRNRDALHDHLFDVLKTRRDSSSSFLLNSSLLASFTARYPNAKTIRATYDPISHLLCPDDLAFLVWFALQQHKVGSKHASPQAKHAFEVFKALPLAASAAAVANHPSRPESLCQLDTEAFLYATVHMTASSLNKSPTTLNVTARGGLGGPLQILPPTISSASRPLCTQRQAEWWSAAYKLTTNNVKGPFSNLGLLRQTLQRGIETVRGMTAHGLDLSMIIHLAKTFQARTQEMWQEESASVGLVAPLSNDPELAEMIGPGEESAAYRGVAELYWTLALELLKKLKKKQFVPLPKERLFALSSRELSEDQMDRLVEEGSFFLAQIKLRSGDPLGAVKEFSKLSSAEASYQTAQALKEVARRATAESESPNDVTTEMRNQRSEALKSALEALFLTMDRTRGNPEHPLHDVLGEEIKEVEKMLADASGRGKPHLTNGHASTPEPNESGNSEDSFYEDDAGASAFPEAAELSCFPLNSVSLPSSTPMKSVPRVPSDATFQFANASMKHVRPSPERLDAQIRSMRKIQEKQSQQMESQAKQIGLLLEVQSKQERRNNDMMEEIQNTKKHILELCDFFKNFAANMTPQAQRGGIPGLAGGGSLSGTPIQTRLGAVGAPLGTPSIAASLPLQNSFYDPSVLPPPVPSDTILQNPSLSSLAAMGTPSPSHFGLSSPSARLFPPANQMVTNTSTQPTPSADQYRGGEEEDEDEEDYEDYDEEEDDQYWVEDDDENPLGPPPKHVEPPSLIPDNAPCDYPYGQITSMQGRSTITYQAPHTAPSSFGPSFFSNAAASEMTSNFLASKSASPVAASVDTNKATTTPSLPKTKPSAEAAAAFVRQLGGNDPIGVAPPNVVPTMAFTTPPLVTSTTVAGVTPTAKPFTVNFNPNAAPKLKSPTLAAPPPTTSSTFSATASMTLHASPEKNLEPGGGFKISLSPDAINNKTPSVFNTGSGVASTILQNKEDVENESEDVEKEIDPYPDFKPIIDLPEQVPVVTGEEDEEVLFSERAKLFRFAETGEWKERGLGPIKILKNAKTGKTRLLMRREQIHKVCLNHVIPGGGLNIRSMESNDKALLWPAMDYAESTTGTHEKFCVRFKTKDLALQFKQIADANAAPSEEGKEEEEEEKQKPEAERKKDSEDSVTPKAPAFGFTNTNMVSFKDLAQPSGKTGFSSSDPNFKFPGSGSQVFSASTEDEHGADDSTNQPEDYVPEVDFKPVVPLPDLVDVKTGEEEEEELYKHRAKLHRFCAETKEFKERGLGDIKILRHKKTGKVRVILRREQVLKLACNFHLVEGIELKPLSTSERAFQWICMDFSEGELKQEGFAVKFKNEDVASGFKQAWKDALDLVSVKNSDAKKDETDNGLRACKGTADKFDEIVKESEKPTSGFGDAFKAKPDSWECSGCFTRNEAKHSSCPCCNTPGPNVSTTEKTASGFGDAFKPKQGTWECSGCLIRNDASAISCPCCNTRNPNAPKDAATKVGGGLAAKLASSGGGGGFSFGSPSCSTGGIQFGTSSPASSAPVFGTSSSSTPVFGSSSPMTPVFGVSTTTSTTSAPIFGSSSSTTTAPVFGTSLTSTAPVFGNSSSTTAPPVFGTGSPITSTSTASFGSNANSNNFVFGFSKPSTPLFGSGAPKFGSPITSVASPKPVSPKPPAVVKPSILGTPPQSKDVPAIFGGTGQTPPSSFVIGGQTHKPDDPKPAFNLGGFTFGSTPVVEKEKPAPPKEEKKIASKATNAAPPPATGLFSGFKGFGNAAATDAVSPVSFSSILAPPKSEASAVDPDKASTTTTTVETTSTWAPPAVFSFAANKPLFSIGRTNSESSLAESDSAVSSDTDKAPRPTPVLTKTDSPTLSSSSSFAFGETASSFAFGEAAKTASFTFSIKPEKEKLVVKSPVKGEENDDDDDGDDAYYQEEDGDHIHFEPVVPLPDKILVKTGEEDEEEVFADRGKLFRFTDGEWKERGLGIMKILKNKMTNKHRLLMRREQVLKICCNHLLTPDVVLKPMANSDKAWVWHALDGSEDVAQHENFAIRFKTASLANDFKSIVDRLTSETDASALETPPSSPRPVQSPDVSSSSSGECLFVDERLPSEDLMALAEKYMLPKTFYNYLDKPPCPGCPGCDDYDKVVSSTTQEEKTDEPEAAASNYEPAKNDAAVAVATSDATPLSGFGKTLFGENNAVSFADLAKKSSGGFIKESSFAKPGGFGFAGLGSNKPIFASPKSKEEEEENDDDEEVSGGADPHFEPVVPLPELVSVKTGEEGDEVLFCSRAKLYRIDDKAWKERGVGEMKLLQNPRTNRLRVLHRREQVYKVVCNHLVEAGTKMTPLSTSEAAICWYAQDFSEGSEGKTEQFAARFKTKNICDEFKSIVDAAAERERNKAEEEDGEKQDSETESNNGY